MPNSETKVIVERIDGFQKLMEVKFANNDSQHEEIKKVLHKKANKWAEYVLKGLMTGVGLWVLGQLLNLIPKIRTAYIYLNTIT